MTEMRAWFTALAVMLVLCPMAAGESGGFDRTVPADGSFTWRSDHVFDQSVTFTQLDMSLERPLVLAPLYWTEPCRGQWDTRYVAFARVTFRLPWCGFSYIDRLVVWVRDGQPGTRLTFRWNSTDREIMPG